MSSLLYGVASEEYLSFCDDVSLDELSSSLKPTPRRMFEYYRKRLWQPYDCTEELIPFGTSQVSTIADVEESHEKISQVMHGSDRSQDSSDTLGEVSSLERSKCFQNSEKLEDNNHEKSIHCKPTALQSSDATCRTSTESEMNFTGKSKTASLASKLTLFLEIAESWGKGHQKMLTALKRCFSCTVLIIFAFFFFSFFFFFFFFFFF